MQARSIRLLQRALQSSRLFIPVSNLVIEILELFIIRSLRLTKVEVHFVGFVKLDRVKRHKLIFAGWLQLKSECGFRSGKVRQRVGRKMLLPPYQNRRAVDESNTFGMLLVNGRVEKFHGEFNRDSVARVPLRPRLAQVPGLQETLCR